MLYISFPGLTMEIYMLLNISSSKLLVSLECLQTFFSKTLGKLLIIALVRIF